MKKPSSLRLLAAAIILCLGLAGCEPKAMTAFAAWEPEIVLFPGDHWEGDIPADGKDPSYSIIVNSVPGLDALVEEGRLTLAAHEVGEGQLTLAASAKGYHDTTLTLGVRVEPLPLEISWELAEAEPDPDSNEEDDDPRPSVWADGERIGAKAGTTFTLLLSAARAENASFELSLPSGLGEVRVEGKRAAVLVGEEYGEGVLSITASAPDLGSKTLSVPFSVVHGMLPLTVTSQGAEVDSVELERDSSVTVTASTENEAEVSATIAAKASSSSAAPTFDAKLSKNGDAFTITGNAVGEGVLTVTAKADGWLENTVQLPVKIIKPTAAAVPEDSQHNDVTVEPGGWIGIPLAIRPAGATVTASVEEAGFTAEISGSTLTVAADKDTLGDAEIKLTVSADGYITGSTTINATAKLAPVKLTASSDTLSMESGESKAVNLTATPADADITVYPDDGLTARYSSGRLTVTATASGTVRVSAKSEGRDPAEVVIKVVVADEKLPNVDTSAYAGDAAEIIRLTNEYRKANGVGTLEHIAIIDVPAAIRANEAAESWSHTRPDGSEFATVFAQCGLKYAAYGENLFSVNTRFTPEQVLQEWKDSPSHDENLLRPEFDGIGVGICKVDGEYYYCQLFISE